MKTHVTKAAGWIGVAVLSMAFLLSIATLSACAVQADYVSADKATFDAITPEYLRYVYGDATLSEDEKKRRLRTVETWRERLKAMEKP